MPRHFDNPHEAWETFLNTLQGGEAITVTKVTPKTVTFSISSIEDLKDFKGLLRDPEDLRSKLLQALGKEKVVSTTAVTPKTSTMIDNVVDFLHNIFGADFLKEVGITDKALGGFKNNLDLQTATLQLTGSSLEVRRDLTEFQILQSTISNEVELGKILFGTSTFHEQSSKISEFAQEVIRIDLTTGTVTFNYGALLHAAQTQGAGDSIPVIASTSTGEYTIDKSVFLDYISEVIPSGMIFQPLPSSSGGIVDQVLPILFKGEATDEIIDLDVPHRFEILPDVSGSMSSSFEQYQIGLQSILAQIADATRSPWKMSITAFNNTITKKSFSSTDGSDVAASINTFISRLEPRGGTDLHCPLQASFDSYKGSTDRATIIILTDGVDNIGRCTKSNLMLSASTARDTNPQLAMFSIGYGEAYDAPFFQTLSTEGGFFHIHLNDIAKLEEQLGQHIRNIDQPRALYKFLLEEGKVLHEQVSAGEVAVGQTSIPIGTKISTSGIEYTIGTAPAPVPSSYWGSIKGLFSHAINYLPSASDVVGYLPSVDDVAYATRATVGIAACQYGPKLIGIFSNYCVGMIGNSTDSEVLMLGNEDIGL